MILRILHLLERMQEKELVVEEVKEKLEQLFSARKKIEDDLEVDGDNITVKNTPLPKSVWRSKPTLEILDAQTKDLLRRLEKLEISNSIRISKLGCSRTVPNTEVEPMGEQKMSFFGLPDFEVTVMVKKISGAGK